jgi:hypothetical protein
VIPGGVEHEAAVAKLDRLDDYDYLKPTNRA